MLVHNLRPRLITRWLLPPSTALWMSAGVAGCGDDSSSATGDLTILLEPEDTIISGISSGDGVEEIQDGWNVQFDRYLITIGDIEVAFATERSRRARARDLFVVDLKRLSETGDALWSLSDLAPGRWEFYYRTAGAGDDAKRHDTVEASDFDRMEEDDLTYWIEGAIHQEGGVSCPPSSLADPSTDATSTNDAGDACYPNADIAFSFGVRAETRFGPCEFDGVSGVSIPEGGTGTVAATIHGDHLFFNGFPAGDEGGIVRLAQWLADSDLNVDGEVTRDELEAIIPADLPVFDDRYQTGATPLELNDMWDYVIGQLKTQGHMNGEGECPFDGASHEQEHDESESNQPSPGTGNDSDGGTPSADAG